MTTKTQVSRRAILDEIKATALEAMGHGNGCWAVRVNRGGEVYRVAEPTTWTAETEYRDRKVYSVAVWSVWMQDGRPNWRGHEPVTDSTDWPDWYRRHVEPIRISTTGCELVDDCTDIKTSAPID